MHLQIEMKKVAKVKVMKTFFTVQPSYFYLRKLTQKRYAHCCCSSKHVQNFKAVFLPKKKKKCTNK